MGKDLIIVESPAKVKTIKKFLGNRYQVQASVGHIRDLPRKEIGVDEEHGYQPQYVTIQGKEKIVNELQSAAAKADTVYLAPDPDREGEAIAWHIAEVIKDKAKNIQRIQFNEITARAVREALEKPRDINASLFEAQQARRIMDRLVGYKISPLLWKTVKRGISAGRVQSVALRLIAEREEERKAFIPEEYWLFKVLLLVKDLPDALPIKAELVKVDGKKAKIDNASQADALEKSLAGKPFIVEKVEEKERSRSPSPPFITSTLQQTANQRLGFSAKRTMSTAQRLYEGMELGELGTTALITYMRTDSVRISDEARQAAAEFIGKNYGSDYLPAGGKGRVFSSKNSAQDAHEAIRPVDVNILPDEVKQFLAPDQYRLYSLIWARFVASQMANARFHDTTALFKCAASQWKAKGERLLFPGFLAALPKNAQEEESLLPPLQAGQELSLDKLQKEQKFTQPAARFSEATLVKELEEKGIGRPSTYTAIISTIVDREYVRLEDKHFIPTELGNVVCNQLKEHFPDLMDVGFTAGMEGNLDKVADGELGWVDLLDNFGKEFYPALQAASGNMKPVKAGLETRVACPQCGKPLMVKFGKSGEFLACAGYPDCRFTTNFTRDDLGEIQLKEKEQPVYEVAGLCPKCQGNVVIRKSRTGSRFLGCVNYPTCDYAAPFSTKVPCPRCKSGELVEKSSKRGKIFYSCNQYPKCDYALWDYPINEACPVCDSPLLTIKTSKAKGQRIACPNPKCRYSRPLGDDQDDQDDQDYQDSQE